MDQKMMLQMLGQNADTYRAHRPATAEMDLSIFRAYCSGERAVQIAMKIPCAESTVYRALRRVKDFMNGSERRPFMEILRKHISVPASPKGSSLGFISPMSCTADRRDRYAETYLSKIHHKPGSQCRTGSAVCCLLPFQRGAAEGLYE